MSSFIDFVAIALDAADSIAMGIPSAVVAGELARKYDVEIAALQNMINKVEAEINANPQMDRTTLRSYLASQSRSYSPLGMARQKFDEAYSQSHRSKYDDLSAKRDKLMEKKSNLEYQRDRPRGLSAGIRSLVGADKSEVTK